ncbi:MAG TPA: AIM24 family protein, partial [Bacilli bacterium]|nr:AIM24 family protein [Bacilli bacterium]
MKYQIEGGSLPVLIVNLEVGEKLITEGGAMSWMSGNMKMDTSSGG